MKKIFIILIVCLCAAGCQPMNAYQTATRQYGLLDKQYGAQTTQVTSTVNGTLPGSYIARSVGVAYMDPRSQAAANQAAQYAFQYGQLRYWRTSGSAGRVVPLKAYRYAGSVCRPFATTVQIYGRTQKVSGIACKNPRGQWIIQ